LAIAAHFLASPARPEPGNAEITNLSNATGTIEFTEPLIAPSDRRFYRVASAAQAPP